MATVSNSTGSDSSATNDTTRGILYLCAGLFVFSFQDIIIKLLSASIPVHEIVFVRGLVAAPLIFLYVHLRFRLRCIDDKTAVAACNPRRDHVRVLHVVLSGARRCAFDHSGSTILCGALDDHRPLHPHPGASASAGGAGLE